MKYQILTKKKECLPFDEWITKLEMRAFGWRYRGCKTTYFDSYTINIDWDRETATATQDRRHDNVFKRITPYSFNPIFKFAELLMAIQSWIRRKLIVLFFGLTILGLIAGILSGDFSVIGLAFAIVSFVYLPSLFLAGVGFALRKLLKIDEKLAKSLERNGYAAEQNF